MSTPSTALPRDAYRDPAIIVAEEQKGDVMPRSPAPRSNTCFDCVHQHAPEAIHPWPCLLNAMPSARTGRCRLWEPGA